MKLFQALFFFAVFSAVSAQHYDSESSTSENEYLNGTVYDEVSNSTVAGVQIIVQEFPCTTFTGPDGSFTLCNNAVSFPFSVSVTASGYHHHSISNITQSNIGSLLGKIILTPSNTPLKKKKKKQWKGNSTLYGIVSDSLTGAPLAGVTVTVKRISKTFTDKSGTFFLSGLKNKKTTLIIEGTGYNKCIKTGVIPSENDTVLIALSPITQTVISADDKQGSVLTGTVSESLNNHAVAAARISLSPSLISYSDFNGNFRIPGVPDGSYTIEVTHDEFDTVRLPVTISQSAVSPALSVSMNRSISKNVSLTVSGQVLLTEKNKPIEDVLIAIEESGEQTRTDTAGFFHISPGTDSTTTLIASKSGFAPSVFYELKGDTFIYIHLVPDTSRKAREQTKAFFNSLVSSGSRMTSFSITVVEKEGEFPVENAKIFFDGVLFGKTPSGGSIQYSDIPIKKYDITIVAEGYDTCFLPLVTVSKSARPLRVRMQPHADLRAKSKYGRLYGSVRRDSANEPLVGVRVVLQGTKKEILSDMNGIYRFPDIRPGEYQLAIDFHGFTIKGQPSVTIKAGTTIKTDIIAQKDTTDEIQRMYVGSTVLASSGAGLLKERKMTFSVSNGISSSEMSKAGASNAADAVKKVTGVTVAGGKYVYIRGMGERYVNVTLNNQAVPSPDPDKRALPLDLFPTGLLENIVTNKSFSPDLPGAFAGGNVNIKTRSVPEGFLFNASLKTGGNSTTTGQEILSYDGGSLDWLGSDDGTRAIPEAVSKEDLAIPTYSTANNDTALAADLDRYSRAFNNKWYFVDKKGFPDIGGAVSVGNSYEIDQGTVGGLLSLTYSNKTTFYKDGLSGRYEAGGNIDEASMLIPEQRRTDTRTVEEVLWGGLATLGTSLFDKNHTIDATSLFVHSSEDETRILFGKVKNLDNDFESRLFQFSERNLFDVQMSGDHNIPRLSESLFPVITWKGSLATTRQDQPDIRQYLIEHVTDDPDQPPSLRFPTTQPLPSRYFRTLDEKSFQGSGDLTLHFDRERSSDYMLKTGAAFQTKQRDYSEQYFQFTSIDLNASINSFDGDVASYFGPENSGLLSDSISIYYNRRTRQWDTLRINVWGVVVKPLELNSNYTATNSVPALYGMASWKFFDCLKTIAGIRVEGTQIKIDMLEKDTMVNIDKYEWLPSINAIYALTDAMDLRAVYGRTLARPVARELAPIGTFNIAMNANYIGNPYLEQTVINNADLRWEWTQNVADLLAASIFYKYIQKPIELVIIDENGTLQHQNVQRGQLFGFELENRFSLKRLNPNLDGLQLGMNFAFIQSQVDLGEDELKSKQFFDPNISTTRQLQGQSPYVFNCDLSYANEQLGLSTGFFFNIFGERIAAVSKAFSPDVYEQPAPMLDFMVEKSFIKNCKLKISVKNIFDVESKKTYTFKKNKYFYERNRKGRSLSISIGYSFK